MATISGQGVDGETTQRILDFLNRAQTAADIAGKEPQAGPVHDDPRTGYGDQIADYDIGETVARRIIDRRMIYGVNGFTDLAQLSGIPGFGRDKFKDLVFSFGPASYGKWTVLPDSPVYVVHAAVLRTGKVLMYAGTAEVGYPLNSATWNPKTGTYKVQSGTDAYSDDLFCSHHVALADGNLLVNGGAVPGTARGIKATYEFNPSSETWVPKTDMQYARWYPTTVAVPVDKAITMSGYDHTVSIASKVESYDPHGNSHQGDWDTLPAGADRTLEIYPGLHLMPDGKILYTGTRWDGAKGPWVSPGTTALFDLATNTWSPVGDHVVRDRTEGMSVVLPPDNKRVLVIGGRGDRPISVSVSTNTVEMIDFNDATPTWKQVAGMHYSRRNVNAVLLPTGRVLVCAGISGWKWGSPGPSPVYTAEEYDPTANKWVKLAAMKVPRQYHSCSLLLPDARVLNLGSVESVHGAGHDLIKDVEVFSPPYLFRGPRPKITSVDSVVHHGQKFAIGTLKAADIGSVVLVRPMAITHHTDSEQRVIPLKFTKKNSTTLTATAPNGNHPHYNAQRGYYMLFLVSKKDIPSEAKFVQLH
ncbi:MAG: galactose oxidase-like domain-containing protein [Acidimicrobiia bacterium]